jgi:hypothetical protein
MASARSRRVACILTDTRIPLRHDAKAGDRRMPAAPAAGYAESGKYEDLFGRTPALAVAAPVLSQVAFDSA